MLCLLKDSDPLQRGEIRLMALVERRGKMLSVYHCTATGTEGYGEKEGAKEDKVTFGV